MNYFFMTLCNCTSLLGQDMFLTYQAKFIFHQIFWEHKETHMDCLGKVFFNQPLACFWMRSALHCTQHECTRFKDVSILPKGKFSLLIHICMFVWLTSKAKPQIEIFRLSKENMSGLSTASGHPLPMALFKKKNVYTV